MFLLLLLDEKYLESIEMVTYYDLNGANIFGYSFEWQLYASTCMSQVGNFLLFQFFKGF